MPARTETACSAWATTPLPVPFSPVIRTLASDGPTRAMTSSTGRIAADWAIRVGPPLPREQLVFLLEPAIGADGAAELDLVLDDREQARVVPRLGDEIARAAAHGLDGDIDAGPRGHHDDRQGGIGAWSLASRSRPSWPVVVSRA